MHRSCTTLFASALVLLSILCYAAGSVDVIIYANVDYAVGVAAAIQAARRHTRSHIRFFVGFDGDPESFKEYLACVGVDATDVVVRRPHSLVEAVSA